MNKAPLSFLFVVSFLVLLEFNQDAYAVPQVLNSDITQMGDIVLNSVDGFIIDGDIIITSTTGDDVTLNGAIDAPNTGGSLIVNTLGTTTFNGVIGGGGVVGGGFHLDSLTTNFAGSTVIVSSSGIDLRNLIVSGSLTVTSTGGSITDSGQILVTGTTTIIAANDVTLDDPSLNLGGTVSVSANNLILVHPTSVELGDLDILGNLFVTSTTGSITDSGAGVGNCINVAGTTSLTAVNSITLNCVTNDFVGAVSVSASSLVLVDSNSIVLGTINVPGSITIISDNDGDTFLSDVDCNDNDASINPDATEVCDGVDNDCDTNVDEEDLPLCNDNNACTVDACLGGSCSNTSADDGTFCDLDSDFCTDDLCQSGTCTATGNPVDCTDGNECTLDLCFANTGCINDEDPLSGSSCNLDSNVCTVDTCSAGICLSTGTDLNCNDDMNECTAEICDQVNGCQSTPVMDGVSCDGGLGMCSIGVCVPDGGTEPAIGGKIIPIETTSLILAGTQSFSWMTPVVLSVLGIGLVLVRRK